VNDHNRKRVREAIDEAADQLKDKLPPSPRHPKGRKPHAHVAKMLKVLMGCSYTEIADEHTEDVITVVGLISERPL